MFGIQSSRRGFKVKGLGLMVSSHGAKGYGSRVYDEEFTDYGSGFRIYGLGFRVQGSGCRV